MNDEFIDRLQFSVECSFPFSVLTRCDDNKIHEKEQYYKQECMYFTSPDPQKGLKRTCFTHDHFIPRSKAQLQGK